MVQDRQNAFAPGFVRMPSGFLRIISSTRVCLFSGDFKIFAIAEVAKNNK